MWRAWDTSDSQIWKVGRSQVVKSPSCVWLFAACKAYLSLTVSWSLPKFMPIALVMPSSQLILWHPLLLWLSVFPSIRDFSDESVVCIRWPKYRSFIFSISPSNEYLGLISFKIVWFNRLTVQGNFRSFLQHQSSKASILWHSAFLMVQLLQLTTGKTIALTIWTFAGRMMYLFRSQVTGI